MIEDEIITGQEFSPTGLTTVQDLCGHEGFKILVIGANTERVFGSFKIVTPVVEVFDNGEHFMIMDIVIAFHRDTLSGLKCDEM